MFCTYCGGEIKEGDLFCANCGAGVKNDKTDQNVDAQGGVTVNQMTQDDFSVVQDNKESENLEENSDKKEAKIFAILSIVIPIATMIWYWFIGLTVYLAIIIAGIGFAFSKKGESYNKTLSLVGKVCNCLLVAMAIIMFIILFLERMRG